MRFLAFFMLAFVPMFSAHAVSVQEKIERIAHGMAFERDERFLSELFEKGYVERCGQDKAIRPSFVSFQALLEQTLADLLRTGELSSVRGAIHTPSPTTPLCTRGEILKYLTTEEIAEDFARIKTIRDRVSTFRELLSSGAKFFIVYPEEGLEKRTPEQREIYQQSLLTYQQSLVDCPIQESLPNDLIGASYVFCDQDGVQYFFSIQATQANDARDGMIWRIWLGELNLPACQERGKIIDAFIQKNARISLFPS